MTLKINTVYGEEIVESKICLYCKKEKYLHEFNFRYYDGKKTSQYEGRCRKCFNKSSSIRRELYKSAPPKTNYCECCGKEKDINGKKLLINLDHDRDTKKFRGWLCKPCNTAIGQLGDNLEGVMKAANYLKSRK